MSQKGKNSPMVLRLMADMLRQHAKLFSQQATILERVATQPQSEESWNTEEESPREIQTKIMKQKVVELALRTYEGMLDVQKRVDDLEITLQENGIELDAMKLKHDETIPKSLASKPIFWLKKDYGDYMLHKALEVSAGNEEKAIAITDTKVKALWDTMNPSMRQPYIEKARNYGHNPIVNQVDLDNQWEKNYALLEKFRVREGHGNVRRRHEEDGFPLGDWIDSQRKKRKRGTLDPDHEKKLEAMGVWYSQKDRILEEKFTLLDKFRKREGHGNVPRNCVEDGIDLGIWIMHQRQKKKKKKLDPVLVKRLEDMGVSWDSLRTPPKIHRKSIESEKDTSSEDDDVTSEDDATSEDDVTSEDEDSECSSVALLDKK